MIRLLCAILISIFTAFSSSATNAATPLPYSTRTHNYNGWSSFTLGDIRTVGMGGATVGLGDTFLAASDNPAGLAMVMAIGDTNYTADSVHDNHVQNFDDPLQTSNLGVSLSLYPWGLSLGYVTSSVEGAPYSIAGQNEPANLNIVAHELRMGLGHVFLNGKFSLGVSLNLGQAKEEIQYLAPGGVDQNQNSYAVGATVGSMVQLPHRLLLGLSYVFPMTYSMSNTPTIGVNSFFQNLETPSRLGLGLGWIPNRFFRTDLTLERIGTNSGSALLSDDSRSVGSSATWQPRFGFAYIFSDIKNFRGTYFTGTYFESSRIEGADSRLHGTAGVEIKPYFITTGLGADFSNGYRNLILSIGVDVFNVMERLELIPRTHITPYGGWAPTPFHDSDVGLPRTLVKDWHDDNKGIDPVKIALGLPKKIVEATK